MSLATNSALQSYATALVALDKMEEGFKNALTDLRALKEGKKQLADLVITDDGYDFVPAEPEEAPSDNGARTEPVPADIS